MQISIERLGDILNAPMEPSNLGACDFAADADAARSSSANVTFRYRPGAPEVLKDISLAIQPGEVDRRGRTVRLRQVDARPSSFSASICLNEGQVLARRR